MRIKILLISIFLFIAYAYTDAQVRVPGGLKPSSDLDTYPTHFDSLGFGGFVSLPTLVRRDAITAARRTNGMMVYVEETDKVYQLKGGVANVNWTELNVAAGSGGGAVFNGTRVTLSTGPALGTNLNTSDLSDWINKAYFTMAPTATLGFTGFTYTSTTQFDSADVEMRAEGAGPQSINLMWNIGRQTNSSNIVAANISGALITPVSIASFPSADNTNTSATVSGATFSSTFNATSSTSAVFTLSATDAIGKSVAKNLTINFRWKRYYGFIQHPSANSNGTDFAASYFVAGGANQNLINTSLTSDFNGNIRDIAGKAVTHPGGGAKRLVVAFPAAWDTGTRIIVNGFDVTDSMFKHSYDVRNANGGVAPYVIYISKYDTDGNVQLRVQ